MKYRITKQYSLDAMTGIPQSNYMVESKKNLFSPWLGVQMFVTRKEAEEEIKVRRLSEGKIR